MDCKCSDEAGILSDKAHFSPAHIQSPLLNLIYTPSRFIRPRRPTEMRRKYRSCLWSPQVSFGKLKCERVLDAPGLQKSFACNPMDISHAEILAIALAERIFLWTAGQTRELPSGSGMVGSLSWRGDALAIARAPQLVRLYDANTLQCSRQLSVSKSLISAMAFHDSLLACGSNSGKLYFVDVRVRRCKVLKPSAHSDTIAGASWSPEGSWLASTGLDSKIKIWEMRRSGCINTWDLDGPAKAIAWAPHQRGILASGSSVLKSFSVLEDATQQSQDKGALIGGLSWKTKYLLAGVGSELELLDSAWRVQHRVEAHAGGCLQLREGASVYSMGGEEAVKVWQHI